MPSYEGQNLLNATEAAAVALGPSINHLVGTGAKLVTGNGRLLVVSADKGGARIMLGDNADRAFGFGDVDAVADEITVTAHTFVTGARVTLENDADDLPVPLTETDDFFVIVVDDDTVKLATSLVNAVAGTAIDLSDVGTGDTVIGGMAKTIEFPAADILTGAGAAFVPLGASLVFPAISTWTAKGFGAGAALSYWYI